MSEGGFPNGTVQSHSAVVHLCTGSRISFDLVRLSKRVTSSKQRNLCDSTDSKSMATESVKRGLSFV